MKTKIVTLLEAAAILFSLGKNYEETLYAAIKQVELFQNIDNAISASIRMTGEYTMALKEKKSLLEQLAVGTSQLAHFRQRLASRCESDLYPDQKRVYEMELRGLPILERTLQILKEKTEAAATKVEVMAKELAEVHPADKDS